MPQDPLSWLDAVEEQCKLGMRVEFKREVNLLERQINLISTYVGQVGKLRAGTGLTIAQLKRSQDDRLLSRMVPAFLMFQALDNLQASRLNILHGYLSVALACLRNVAEALHWANAAEYSAGVAREWLNSKRKFRKPNGFVLDPRVQELMRTFDRLSKSGAHPLAAARTYSALAKPEARKLLGDQDYVAGIRSSLNLASQVSANFLFFLLNHFQEELQKDLSLRREVNTMLRELNATFGIKQVRQKQS